MFYLRIQAASASVVLLILAVLLPIRVNNAYGQLVLFRATEDEQAYAKDPSKYDRVDIFLAPTREKVEVYIERVATLKLAITEVKSVIIEKDEFLGLRSTKNRGNQESDRNYVYTATFYLTDQGGKKFKDFAQMHDQELFDVRIETKRLGVGRILGPFPTNVFTAGLEENNADRAREILSPIKNKVIWK